MKTIYEFHALGKMILAWLLRTFRAVSKKKLSEFSPKPNQLRQLRVGFLPLVDCAPMVVARERGLFLKYGLNVILSREVGWATVRDKIIYGELDVSMAVAGLAHAASYGLGSIVTPCVSAMVIDANANGITLSNELFRLGVRDAQSFHRVVEQERVNRTLTLGTVNPFSSHNFLLRQWLRSGGIDPDRDVRIVIVPPSQMCQNLKAGHLDGFCVGEPWNSVAVQNKIGWTVSISTELNPGHPDKILMVREQFAEKCHEQHQALLAALLEACVYCDDKAHAREIAALLSRPEYLDIPARAILPSLSGVYDFGHGRTEKIPDFISFHRNGVNEPTGEKEAWVRHHLNDNGFIKLLPSVSAAPLGKVFRADLFQGALARISQVQTLNKKQKSTHPTSTESK